MDEKKFLENFAKILGSGAQEELDKIEQKRLREEKLLKSFGAALSKTADFEVKIEEEIPAPRQVKLPANFIKKTATPKIVIESPLVDVVSFIEPIEETIEEKIAVTGIANTNLSDFVSQATSFTTKYEKGKKKASGEETEQREIDKINNTLRKEIELIKKSISEFHRLLHLQAMKLAWGGGGSSGGGEVWLKKLDDVDYQSLKNASDGQVLIFDGVLKKWVASDNYGGGTGGGTGGGSGDAIGPRGYRGSQGIHGFTGSGGLHGFSGSKGNTGFAGSVGFGIDGFTGSTGAGFVGSAGIGYAGSGGAGYTGSKGDASTSRIINYNYLGDGTANTFTIEGGYIANSVVVFLNGVKQVVGYDVFIDSGSTVNFTDPPPAEFIIDVFGYQANSIIGEGGGTNGGGYTGSQGLSGAAVDKGYDGSQGALGYTGSIGPQGFRGLFGFTGSEGIGYVGSHGLQGERGDLGPQGEQGEQGPVGLQGEPGPVGNDGTRGAKGYTGSASTVVGYSGSIGPQGIGFVGSLGSLGFTGSRGTGYVGSRGAIGFDGPQGEIGYSGSQGIAGEFAALGYTGSGGTSGSSDRITSNGYEVVLASTGQLNIPSADNTEGGNARIQSSVNIDILSNLSLWTFGTDSVLTLPEHGKIVFNSSEPEQYIEGTQGFHIHASDGVSIDVGANTYSFGNDGIFTTSGTMKLPVLTAEPSYPTSGLMAVSDGTYWNPVDTGVENLVIYLNNTWVKLG
jgi:hypothetical protein